MSFSFNDHTPSDLKIEINRQFAEDAARVVAKSNASVMILDAAHMHTTTACVRAGIPSERIVIAEAYPDTCRRQLERIREMGLRTRLAPGDAFVTLAAMLAADEAPAALFLDLTAAAIRPNDMTRLLGWAKTGRLCYITLAARYRSRDPKMRTVESRTNMLRDRLKAHGLFLHEAIGYRNLNQPMMLLVFRRTPACSDEVMYRPRKMEPQPDGHYYVSWYGFPWTITREEPDSAAVTILEVQRLRSTAEPLPVRLRHRIARPSNYRVGVRQEKRLR